jgi:kynurenine formamidase
VELSHAIEAGMTTYPGLPGPEIISYLTREQSRQRYAEGVEFAIDRITMVGNTGTYVDSPFHRYADGPDLASVPLGSVADLPIVVIEVGGTRAVGSDAFAHADTRDKAVLFHTGWDRHWRTEAYGTDAPYLTGEAAQALVHSGVKLVGIDSLNIDDARDPQRPVHSILLRHGVPVLEHLTNLAQLPATGARLHAVPPRIVGFSSFPVRAYAVVLADPPQH